MEFMIDFARIKVIAGNGGRGAGSFMHIKGKRRGKADGGDGGRGGNVYLVASADLNTLEPFRFIKEYSAKNGGNGEPNRRKGAEGEDLEIKVPVGTTIRVTDTMQESRIPNLEPITWDLDQPGMKVLIGRGGEGGRGNAHLRDEYGRRPLVGEAGDGGEVINLELELKLIADVGLVGLPNAGKSTLIAKLTSARPKIAPYPFTTLEPNLGVLAGNFFRVLPSKVPPARQSVSDLTEILSSPAPPSMSPEKTVAGRIVLADIPGLIEGASEGKGLGDLFLRHIERTKIILHLVEIGDVSAVWANYQIVRNELKNYSKSLFKKREIVVVTKIDLALSGQVGDVKKFFGAKRKRVVFVSALTGEGISDLVKVLLKSV